MRTTTRTAGFVAVIAVVTAVLTPAVSAQAAVPQITGTVTSGPSWLDPDLIAEMKVNQPYVSSIQGPTSGGFAALTTLGLPDGLTATLNVANGVITVSGTPTTAETPISFSFSYAQDSEVTYTISFTGVSVVPDKIATTTTVTTSEFSHYLALNLQATVSSATSGGVVDFYIDDEYITTSIVTGTGTATYTGAAPSSFVGSTHTVTADFRGSDTHAPSTSSNDPTVFIYGSRALTGTVTSNGVPIADETVELQTPAGTYAGHSTITNSLGQFAIILNTPTSLAEASAQYVLYAVNSDVYYSTAGAAGQPNITDLADATVLDQSTWTSPLRLYVNVAPTWTDETLAQPRLGAAYSDSVIAVTAGTPTTITYSVTGDVPTWLTRTGGSFTASNPTDQDPHTFTVTATSTYGSIAKQFTLQAGDAAVPPTFTDTTIADLQVGTPLTDAIAATGDATITYSSTTLPPGLTLNAATGALTGTPTTAGDYTVTFTASNGTDPDATFTWEPTIAAAPDLELVLNFAAGTTIDDADTEIGADGLKVGSTYTLYMHSTPVLLYTGTVGPTGSFLHTVTLPADTPAGAHELILTGIAPDGTVMTAHAWFTLLSNGRIGAISYSGPLSFTLALTGSEPLVPLGIAGALLLAGYLGIRRSRMVRAS